MYEEFLKQIEDFMFIEDKPEKADVIFVPGNGYPNRLKKASISKTASSIPPMRIGSVWYLW